MTSCERSGSEAVRIALKTEQDGLAMYTEASEKARHPFGKKMLLSLAEDERSHICMIQKIAEGLGLSAAMSEVREGTTTERIKTIFSDVNDEVAERIAAADDDVEALRIAMEFEKKGYEFYEKVAAEATCEDEKGLFTELAKQETEHYQILQNTYEYLEDSGHWFQWGEQALLDGG